MVVTIDFAVGYNIIADFFSLISISTFQSVTVLFFISYLIWEIPRTVKVLSEEYTKGIYPEGNRVADIMLFVAGLVVVGYLFLFDKLPKLVSFLKTPGITSFFLILMVVVPLIIIIGYFKRFFSMMGDQESLTIFLVHAFLDLMHVLFFATLSMLAIPTIGLLLMGR